MSEPAPESQTNPRSTTESIGAIVISALVVVGFTAVTMLTVFSKIPDSPLMHDLAGALTAAFAIIVQYWVGSSTGSKAKDAQIARQSVALSQSVPVHMVAQIQPPPQH